MPADPTAEHSDDRSKHCPNLAACAQSDGECGRVMRTSREYLPAAHEIRHRRRGQPGDPMRNRASSIFVLRVIAQGVAE